MNTVLQLSILSLLVLLTHGLDNGAAPTPPLAWSSWNTFKYNISDALIRQVAIAMTKNGLKQAGYTYVLMDDGWPACSVFGPGGRCNVPAPRDSNNRIQPDKNKFPLGMKPLADFVHSLGLKIGIYTAVSNVTCGGYMASLGYEAVDAQTFADWGMDFVKHDTCNYDCGIHDFCLQDSTARMRDGLNATGRRIVYYIDDGNPSSGPRVYNPFMHSTIKQEMIKIAEVPSELVWYWGPDTANIWKSWYDIRDFWGSTMDNIHHQVGLAMYQSCGAYNTPDMLTVGQGSMNEGQYRAQMFMWCVLGSPLMLGNDIRNMDNFTLTLLTAPEVLAVDQDPQCVQASQARVTNGYEVWVKPLYDGSFAVVLLNTLPTPQKCSIILDHNFGVNGGDFWPAAVGTVSVRDLWHRRDLGIYSHEFSMMVAGEDAAILKLTPQQQVSRVPSNMN